MTVPPTPTSDPSPLRRALHPPFREANFWIVQAIVVAVVALHFLVDLDSSIPTGVFPAGFPVVLLVIPVGYAGLRYGLAGSSATAIWGALLWIPDLFLPDDKGHVGADLVNLAIVLIVAFFIGQRIESEKDAQRQAEQTTQHAAAIEAGYRRLFESNHSPILVLDEEGSVSDANPAARDLFGANVLGTSKTVVLDSEQRFSELSGQAVTLSDGRDYRVDVVTLPANSAGVHQQVNFEDVTKERSEQRATQHFAQLVVQVEEDQRRQLSRELHDEPLQLFLHLARRLELLSDVKGVPLEVAVGLTEVRHHALDAANRLRTMARDLRPPVLDELGLIAALSSLVADVDDEGGPSVHFEVLGEATRLSPEIELGAFRIAQESLRNAIRHSNAHHLAVIVDYRTDALELRVSDDGQGFDPVRTSEEGATTHSLGLIGMRERAKLLGGTLEVRSSVGNGTIVTATLPINASLAQFSKIDSK